MSRKSREMKTSSVPQDVLASIAEGLGRIGQADAIDRWGSDPFADNPADEDIHEGLEDESEQPLLTVRQSEPDDPIAPPTTEQMEEHRIEDLVETVAPPAPLPDPAPRMSQERLEMRIRVLRDSCPKAPGSIAARNWALYVDGMTLSAYLSSPSVEGGRRRARRDVAHDEAHGYIELQTTQDWSSATDRHDCRVAAVDSEEEADGVGR